MDISKLIRDASRIHADLYAANNGKIVTKQGCKMYIPARFGERGLAFVGAETRILGLCAIVIADTVYGVLNVNAMVQIDPTSTNMTVINGDQYYEFTFEKGSTVIVSEELIRNDVLLYEIYNEIIAKGRIPWYMSYEDLGKLFTTAVYHGGLKLSANNAIIEMIASVITRDSTDRSKYYRHKIQKMDEQFSKPPTFIPFRSPIYGATNTTAKLIGAYFDDSINSALVNPSEKVEGVETLLRR